MASNSIIGSGPTTFHPQNFLNFLSDSSGLFQVLTSSLAPLGSNVLPFDGRLSALIRERFQRRIIRDHEMAAFYDNQALVLKPREST